MARGGMHPSTQEATMDGPAFDEFSRTMARGLSRRKLLARLGAGGFGAALLGAASLDRARSAWPAAQTATFRLDLVANVRLGASAGTTIGGTVPGELRGQLTFGFDDQGAISGGSLRLADGQELPVVGQTLGRALHLRVTNGDQLLVLVGTAEQDLDSCGGAVDGLLTGPQPGDLGDWHATATSLGSRSGATGGGSGLSGGGVTSGIGSGSGQTPRRTATSEATGAATEEPDGCLEGEKLCGTRCRDLSSDDFHCGACDHACTPLSEQCLDGVCAEIDCGEGLTNCNGVCANLQIDPLFCGVCGKKCADGETCVNGTCQAPVAPAPQDCAKDGESCATLLCCGGTCLQGICAPYDCSNACAPGSTPCAGPAGCSCCEATETCVDGTCQAPAPAACAKDGESCAEGQTCCQSGACHFGICVELRECTQLGQPCAETGDCSAGCICLNGACGAIP